MLQDYARDKVLDLHGRLVGLHFAQHFPGRDLVAFLFQPFDERPHRHGIAELGHFDDFGHGVFYRIHWPKRKAEKLAGEERGRCSPRRNEGREEVIHEWTRIFLDRITEFTECLIKKTPFRVYSWINAAPLRSLRFCRA